ncbi:glycosyltransferase [Bosea sp. Leaf344]|uniref:glycosyltransferase n=1 Tax=Bosea sp. Leaf344 TaxID=1736346 RepID=UPI00138EF0AE|nr:glycosyltransferase [Bosea sp. Leaf344]
MIAVATRDNVTWAKHKLGMDTRSQWEKEHDDAAARIEAEAQHHALVMTELARDAAEAKKRLMGALSDPSAFGIGNRASGNAVLMIVVSDLRVDPRVEREARALAAAGYAVTILCPDPTLGKDPGVAVNWGPGVDARFVDWRASHYVSERPGFEGGLLFDIALRVAEALKPLAIHSHDLNTGLVAYALARMTGAHLVIDFHEWTSENVHWDLLTLAWKPYPAEWRQELKALEHRLVLEASASITVSEHIAQAISAEIAGQRSIHLVRNVPNVSIEPTRPYSSLKEVLGVPDGQFLLLYQGGTGPTRLLEPIIEAMAYAPRCVLVVRGPSLDLYGESYRQIARVGGFADRLILLPPVPSRDVVAAANGADAGIYSVLGLGKNFIYAMPNKIFEYAAAGLPVLAADYPEARRFVEVNGLGLTFDPLDPMAIARAINSLIGDATLTDGFRANAAKLICHLKQNDEWEKLVALYRDLPRRSLASRCGQ